LSADEAGWIGDAEGTDGSDVEEERIIDGFWDEAMANFLLEVLGRGDEDGKRGAERNGVFMRKEGGEAALNQDGMEGAPGFEAGDGKGERRGGYGGSLEPVECAHGLGIRQGRVVF
jgi:hypothetical protein